MLVVRPMGSNFFASRAVVSICTFLLLTSARAEMPSDVVPISGWRAYFGDPLPDIEVEQKEAFDRGFDAFVKVWVTPDQRARNAGSCVECHNIPMPGGSGGTAPVSLVRVTFPSDEQQAIAQRNLAFVPSDLENVSIRRTPSLFGLGLIERADTQNPFPIGMFGTTKTIDEFVSLAFAVELGVSTSSHCARGTSENSYPTVCQAEIDDQTISDIATFLRFLSPPREASGNIRGKAIFEELVCSRCHKTKMYTNIDNNETGRYGNSFEPYSDLVLHNVGTVPVRTAPLWGLSTFGPPYMHDASRSTIEAAILAHDMEALNSRLLYQQLDEDSRRDLISFLKGL